MQVSRSNSGSTRTNNGKPPHAFIIFVFRVPPPSASIIFVFPFHLSREHGNNDAPVGGGSLPSLAGSLNLRFFQENTKITKMLLWGGGGCLPFLARSLNIMHTTLGVGVQQAPESFPPRRPYLVYSGLRRPRTQNADRNPFPPKALSSLFWVYAAPNAKRRID